MLWSQLIGLFVALLGASLLEGSLDGRSALWGAAAGTAGALALAAFYRGLSTGRMAVVAPIAGLVGAGLPVVAGVAFGERPNPLAWLGIALALPAIWLVSGSGVDKQPGGLGLALVAGVGFGLFLIFISRTSDGAGLWPLVPARVASVTVMIALLIGSRTSAAVPRSAVPGVMVAGAGDMAANMLFLVAVQTGLLSVVSVLASLYPAVTVLLARAFGEGVSSIQWVGVVIAAVAAGLIAV